MCGRPSGRTVVIQYSWASSSTRRPVAPRGRRRALVAVAGVQLGLRVLHDHRHVLSVDGLGVWTGGPGRSHRRRRGPSLGGDDDRPGSIDGRRSGTPEAHRDELPDDLDAAGLRRAVPVPGQLPPAHPRRSSTWSSPPSASASGSPATTRRRSSTTGGCGPPALLTVVAVVLDHVGLADARRREGGPGQGPAGRRLPGRPRLGPAGLARAAQPADVAGAVLLGRGPARAPRPRARRRRRRRGRRAHGRGQPRALVGGPARRRRSDPRPASGRRPRRTESPGDDVGARRVSRRSASAAAAIRRSTAPASSASRRSVVQRGVVPARRPVGLDGARPRRRRRPPTPSGAGGGGDVALQLGDEAAERRRVGVADRLALAAGERPERDGEVGGRRGAHGHEPATAHARPRARAVASTGCSTASSARRSTRRSSRSATACVAPG